MLRTLAFIFLLGTAALADERRLAVLELRGAGVEPQVLSLLSEAARTGALGAKGIAVVTRENLLVLLQAAGVDPAACEGECEIETGRKIGADLVITGDVARIEERFVVTLKLHETARGTLLGARQLQGKTQLALVDEVSATTTTLLGAMAAAPWRLTLTFGMQPEWSREQMERLFGPLMKYLAEKTGHDFRLRVTEDYGALLDEMNSGLIDVGKFSPTATCSRRRPAA